MVVQFGGRDVYQIPNEIHSLAKHGLLNKFDFFFSRTLLKRGQLPRFVPAQYAQLLFDTGEDWAVPEDEFFKFDGCDKSPS